MNTLKEKLKAFTIDDLKLAFTNYLTEQEISESTKQTRLSDAFYLIRKNPEFDFIDLVLSDDFEVRARDCIRNTLLKYSRSSNIDKNANGYYSHLKTFRDFLLCENIEKYLTSVQNQSEPATPNKVNLNKNIPKPSSAEVDYYLAEWETLENYVAQEKSLDKLFKQFCPENKNIDDVLAKVAILNDFYSTNIFSTYSVAKHIIELDIDKRLESGDLTLVNDIAQNEIKGKAKNFYSFATKYCSHHYDNVYPIFDSYVEKMLMYFKKNDKFAAFKKEDLKSYSSFCGILNRFREFYNLSEYSLKEIDKYLWQLGKKHFPNTYNKKDK